jgi:hypothetical protein
MPGLDFFGRTFATAVILAAVGFVFFRHSARRFGEEL